MSSGRPSDSSKPEEPPGSAARPLAEVFREEQSDEDEDSGSRPPSPPPENRGGSRLDGAGGSAPGSGSRSSGLNDSLFSWLWKRTVRRGPLVDPARDNFRTMTRLYSSMSPATDSVNLSTQTHGAVFNLEYSPDG